jgi:hypothetical protein
LNVVLEIHQRQLKELVALMEYEADQVLKLPSKVQCSKKMLELDPTSTFTLPERLR